MIDIRDLRVGNWVIINDRLIDKNTSRAPYQYQIEAFDLYKLDSFELAQENGVDPIPLSAEILLAVGFVNIRDVHWCVPSSDPSNSFEICLWSDHVSYTKSNNFHVEMKSLHQLQNLYHSLTGRELVYSHSK